jgi:mono/diheme cytochrome c family protein
MNTSPEMIATGAALYNDKCSFCHGPDAVAIRGTIPDLRYAPLEIHKEWNAIVLGGMLREKGMMPFNLTADQARDIEAYVVQQARKIANKN